MPGIFYIKDENGNVLDMKHTKETDPDGYVRFDFGPYVGDEIYSEFVPDYDADYGYQDTAGQNFIRKFPEVKRCQDHKRDYHLKIYGRPSPTSP